MEFQEKSVVDNREGGHEVVSQQELAIDPQTERRIKYVMLH